MEIKYINDDESLGVEYDLKAIRKVYKSLNIPQEFDFVNWNAVERDKYIINLSERSLGKTTSWLLLGCCFNKLYKTTIQYIRTGEDQLTPSHASKLVEVIRSYNNGEYVRTLTDGKYNSITYHWRQFYYCNVDEQGKVTERSEEPLIQCLSIDKHEDYKSTYNTFLSRGDFIILDEFIGSYYRANEAIYFFDLTKTILRDRISGIIIMLANTINLNSQYFEEFEISRPVKQLSKGEKKEIVTDGGTRIFIEILDMPEGERVHKRKKMNELFYGFKNPKLSAITGGAVWAFEAVPHIAQRDTQHNRTVYINNLYLENGIELLKIELVSSDEQPMHLEVHRATKTYGDSIILSIGELSDSRYKYGFATGRLNKILSKYITERKVFYSSNEVGSIFKDYLHRYKLEKNMY